MLAARTYIVRVYRRSGPVARRLAGVVEIVHEQRTVPFAGLFALGSILRRAEGRRRRGAVDRPRPRLSIPRGEQQ
jgi:hypothetical protein